ncbi:ribosome rescue GTPase HflX [Acidihalobacter prosperus]|uniref:GTPase HflX n=1 Tax=Acidihalobacter prosperus TaxID=160660 RepID=A0A1A6C2M7_9GAMM|nr:ribosome rescue GTPase HflX [Acidihalobacter prosperus]OBS08804.1 GTPase HflX [Acidihalobacter prosperus]
MFERPRSGETAILVQVDIAGLAEPGERDEFIELARSAGATIARVIDVRRHSPDPKYFIGTGKADEIAEAVIAEGAELVIFSRVLSPSQERNLEAKFKARVLDRTGLILDIFAQRARSHEGKLQVELAQLNHLSTRLVRGWTHLERQKGGIGLRGPGETQLETDRRLLGDRIKQILRRLDKVRRQRQQGRQARMKAELPSVALVGYTNAGKSTLFNRLSQAGVYAADQLFATLDPTLRRLELDAANAVVLADTVGFVRELPHELVAAFHATLQETREADLLLHVIDASNPEHDRTETDVDQVLAEVGASEVPMLRIFNKIDCIEAAPRIDRDAEGRPVRAWVSAQTGAGIDELLTALKEYFMPDVVHGWVHLPASAGRLRARLFGLGAVLDERVDDCGGSELEVRLPRRRYDAWLSETADPEALRLRPL